MDGCLITAIILAVVFICTTVTGMMSGALEGGVVVILIAAMFIWGGIEALNKK